MESRRVRYATMILSLIAAIGMVCYYVAILVPHTRATAAHPTVGRYSFGNDFYHVWFTSRICLPHRIDPYSPEVTREIQIGIFGRALSPNNPEDPPVQERSFAYPAFVDFFGLPVAWLPYRVARVVLLILLSVLTAASSVFWAKGLGIKISLCLTSIYTVLTLFSFPGLEALYALQPGLIEAFLLAATVGALVANKQQWAGCALAFSTIKPQISLFLTIYLLLWSAQNWRERRKFVFAFLIALAALSFSFMLIWPNWIVGWLTAVSKYPSYSGPSLLVDLFGFYVGNGLLVMILAGAAWFAWASRRSELNSIRFALTIGLLLTVTVVLLPQRTFYNQIILLPAIMTIVRCWQIIWERSFISKVILTLTTGVLFWQWIAAPVVFFTWTVAPRLSSTMLFLPLRTVLAIPFIVLGVLILVIWRTKENQHLLVARKNTANC